MSRRSELVDVVAHVLAERFGHTLESCTQRQQDRFRRDAEAVVDAIGAIDPFRFYKPTLDAE